MMMKEKPSFRYRINNVLAPDVVLAHVIMLQGTAPIAVTMPEGSRVCTPQAM